VKWSKLGVRDLARSLGRMGLAAISASLGELPKNSTLWTYTITGFDGSPYITRTLMPRIGGRRVMLHRIWRPDVDPHLHNHPWRVASFRILSGGYVEERLVGRHDEPKAQVESRVYDPGDVNVLTCRTFHRITHLEPNTWTAGVIGERVQDWGFLENGVVTLSAEYFKRKQYQSIGGLS
jgi:hypothetical protein